MLGLARGIGGLRQVASGVLDALLPPRCLACGAIVGADAPLCGDCWPRFRFIGSPLCACCGYPFEIDPPLGEPLCGACIRQRPRFARARAALAYDEASRGPILAFKHSDRIDMTASLARWMAQAGAELLEDCDLILPVPLHWTRLFWRRFNQAALLAKELGRRQAKPVAYEILHRRRRTAIQGRKGAGARRRNLAGAIGLAPGAEAKIADRRLLLIDDVLTTGATAEACCNALLAGGAASVDLLTLARALRPRQ